MPAYHNQSLVVLDADGTIVDAFSALQSTFDAHGMALGDLTRFQKRRNLFKYLGGLKEFPTNLRQQLGKRKRRQLIGTLTEVYREHARCFPGLIEWIQTLIAEPDVRVGIVTRNITDAPLETLARLFQRHGLASADLDFFAHIPLREQKTPHFRRIRGELGINPAHSFACGDEYKDYLAAVGAGMHPCIVSYGFDDFDRLTVKHGIPAELVSQTPEALRQHVNHGLRLEPVCRRLWPRAHLGRAPFPAGPRDLEAVTPAP